MYIQYFWKQQPKSSPVLGLQVMTGELLNRHRLYCMSLYTTFPMVNKLVLFLCWKLFIHFMILFI